jgi:hypothetical protein
MKFYLSLVYVKSSMTYDPDFPELDMSYIDPTDSSWLKNDPPKEPPEESRPTEE